jgi:hypothetical protein
MLNIMKPLYIFPLTIFLGVLRSYVQRIVVMIFFLY